MVRERIELATQGLSIFALGANWRVDQPSAHAEGYYDRQKMASAGVTSSYRSDDRRGAEAEEEETSERFRTRLEPHPARVEHLCDAERHGADADCVEQDECARPCAARGPVARTTALSRERDDGAKHTAHRTA